MQHTASHIIQRQVFLLAATSKTTGLEWDAKANEMLRSVIMPVVESCFEALPLGGRHLIIDKLEIDLGVFLPGNFEAEARQRLSHLLSDQLTACHNSGVHTKTAKHAGFPVVLLPNGNHPLNEPAMHTGAAQDPPVLVSTAQALYMVLLHFLQLGTLPWWYPTPATPLADEFTDSWVHTLATGEKSRLKQILLQHPAAGIRMVHLFKPSALSELLEVIHLNGRTALAQWLPLAQALHPFEGLLPVFRQHFWTNWITTSANNHTCLDLPLLLAQTTANDKVLFGQLGAALLAICRQQPSPAVFATYAADITACLKNSQQAAAAGHTTADNNPPAISTSDTNMANISDHTPGNNPGSKANNAGARETVNNTQTVQKIIRGLTPATTGSSKAAAGEELYWHVPDAGIVLLHPFLEELFTSTGLWKMPTWCTEQAPLQAVQLLGWLMNGEQDLPEYQLTFSKILAGLEITTALPATPPLPASAFTMCNELLEAVVTHWKALRNSSPQGLQEAFLQRPGKLTQVNNGYMLQVEQKAQDVLLTHLPWGFATVKLPWMNTILHVSWN